MICVFRILAKSSIIIKSHFITFDLHRDAGPLTSVSLCFLSSLRRRVGELRGGRRREPLPHRVPPPQRPGGRPGEHGPLGRVQAQRRGAEVGAGDELLPAGGRRELQQGRPRAPLRKRQGQEQEVRKRRRRKRGKREFPCECSTTKKRSDSNGTRRSHISIVKAVEFLPQPLCKPSSVFSLFISP